MSWKAVVPRTKEPGILRKSSNVYTRKVRKERDLNPIEQENQIVIHQEYTDFGFEKVSKQQVIYCYECIDFGCNYCKCPFCNDGCGHCGFY